MKQLTLLKPPDCEIHPGLWHGSYNGRETRFHQLSPYVGKMKSGMAAELVRAFSQPGDVVLDPFSGSGVVPLESVIAGREAWANDLSPYAVAVTLGKLSAPTTEADALRSVDNLAKKLPQAAKEEDCRAVPEWVSRFFHPRTLREIVAAFRILRSAEDHFLTAALLGILQHVRPGFLSYPASHLVPYLRIQKYPREQFPHMYEYRPLLPRLRAKVMRAYRNSPDHDVWSKRLFRVTASNAMHLEFNTQSVDAIVSSPPYFGALDYARDNRLRLWFLGCDDWKQLDERLTASAKVYMPQMAACLREMRRVLKPGAACVLVLGDVSRDGTTQLTAELLADLAQTAEGGGFSYEQIIDDKIPDERRSRRRTRTTKFERILILRRN